MAYKLGTFVRSRADNSIVGMILPKPVNGWNAVKLSMSDKPYKGEGAVGSLFNCTRQCWEEVPSNDYKVLAKVSRAFLNWLDEGSPMREIF